MSHAAIMAELVALKQASERGRAGIRKQLRNGSARFDRIEASIQPFADLVEKVGGPEEFAKARDEWLDGLRALAWLARMGRKVALLVITVGGVLTALAAMVKMFFGGFGKGEL